MVLNGTEPGQMGIYIDKLASLSFKMIYVYLLSSSPEWDSISEETKKEIELVVKGDGEFWY